MRRAITTLLIALFTQLSPAAEPVTFERILPPVPTQSTDKIEVTELFWYGCPHCYDFEPYLEKWLAEKPADVEFVRLPAVLNAAWVPHARAYYAAEKLGALEQIHQPLFDALHKSRARIFNEEELRQFFISRGIKAEDFDSAYSSNEVDVKVKQALLLAKRYKISGVPAVIVNGRYRSMRSMVESYEELIAVINQLIEQERQAPK